MELNYKVINENSDSVIVKFNGDILGAAPNLDGLMFEIDSSISEGAKECIIDLEGVKFMDSSGLSMLIRILTKFRNKGGDAVLTHVSEHIQKLLLITKLNSIFEVK